MLMTKIYKIRLDLKIKIAAAYEANDHFWESQ